MTAEHTNLNGEELLKRLPRVRGKYSVNADLAKNVWFRVGGPAEVLYRPADSQDLAFFLAEKPKDIPVLSIGVGSNLLIRDGGIPGVVIKLGKGFNTILSSGEVLQVGAGLLDRSIAMVACHEGIAGFEFLAGIPGTLGGALRMNAGCYGTEIKDRLIAAHALDPQGKLHRLTNQDMGFSYRHCAIPDDWIFVSAELKGTQGNPQQIAEQIEKLLSEREEAQPVRSRTGGSTFANPEGHSAWRLIDAAGCRGLIRGGAQISEKHCNFLINTGNATAEELELLGEEARARVQQTSGIDLRWEIKRVGLLKEAPGKPLNKSIKKVA